MLYDTYLHEINFKETKMPVSETVFGSLGSRTDDRLIRYHNVVCSTSCCK